MQIETYNSTHQGKNKNRKLGRENNYLQIHQTKPNIVK
jgi:hypothetical protein